MGLSFKAGVLRRGSMYMGSTTQIPSKIFDIEKIISDLEYGWLTPANDQGLGSPSTELTFQNGSTTKNAPYAGSKRGIQFMYLTSNSLKETYFVSGSSTQLINGMTSTNPNNLITIDPVDSYSVI